MAPIKLILGPVSFYDFEIPAGVTFGGKQLLALHQLTDGRRVIDCMGPGDTDIEFSGICSGPEASLRARLLNSLRNAGSPLSLTWDTFIYSVVLSRVQFDYRNPTWMPFSVSCIVLRDESRPFPAQTASPVTDITSDIVSAGSYSSGCSAEVTSALNLLASPGATTPNTPEYIATTANLQTLQMTLNSEISAAQIAIESASLAPGGGSTPGTISLLANAAGQLAQLTSASGYLGRAAKTLTCGAS